MAFTLPTAKTLLLASLTILLPAALAVAADVERPKPNNDLERRHERLVREGEQASRAAPPSTSRGVPPNNGIEQIPIDTARNHPLIKQSEQARSDTRRSPAPPQCPFTSGMKTASLLKVFPEVTWHVCVTDMGLKGLWVGPVHLMRTPSSPWMSVLYQAGLAEIFVPYHTTDFRPYDLRYTSALDQVTTQDAGNNGSLIKLTGESVPTVVAEVRDRGVAWLCKQTTMATRRAEEFLVWGISDGGNYDNIVQYGFRDDGGMTFRLGNTGYNYPLSPNEAHMHVGLWRVDMDLNSYAGNSAFWLPHREPFETPSQAKDYKVRFTVEGARQWDASEFNSLLIEDIATSAFGYRLGYEFTPVQSGTSRHFGYKESWTQNDFYVTVYHPNELGWSTTWDYPDNYLLTYISGESTNNNDLIVWVKASAHHDPINEDRSVNDLSVRGTTGVTLVHWSGFNVEPHNLFDTNPMGGPVKCGG